MFYTTGELFETIFIFVLRRKYHEIQIFTSIIHHITGEVHQQVIRISGTPKIDSMSIEVYNHIHSERLLTKFGRKLI